MPTISGGGVVASSLAGFEIGYDQVTTAVTVASTTEASGTTIISCAAHTFDGAAVWAHFYAPVCQPGGGAGGTLFACLFEGATEIARFGVKQNSATSDNQSVSWWIRFTPTAASHTYTVTGFSAGGSGTFSFTGGANGIGAYPPMFVRFIKA